MLPKGRIFLIIALFVAFASQKVTAQDDAEFRMEIGGGLGTSFYLGDVNSSLYKNN